MITYQKKGDIRKDMTDETKECTVILFSERIFAAYSVPRQDSRLYLALLESQNVFGCRNKMDGRTL